MFDKFDKDIKIISKGAPKHMTREHAERMPSTRLGAAVMPSRVWGPGGESVSWDLFLIELCLSCVVRSSTGALQVCVARCEPFVQMQADRLVSPYMGCVLFPCLKMWNSEKKEKHNGNKSKSVGWLLTIEATIESAERRLCPPGSS